MWREIQRRYTDKRIWDCSATESSVSAPVFDILDEKGIVRGYSDIVTYLIEDFKPHEHEAFGRNLTDRERIHVANIFLLVGSLELFIITTTGITPFWLNKYYEEERQKNWYNDSK